MNTPNLQDIRDIRPPFHLSQPYLWIGALFGCCVLAGLGFAAWRWHRNRTRARLLTAHELALARLQEARALMLPWLAREFSITVSDIIRGYIEQRFEIRTAQRTTPEFLRDCLTGADGVLQANRESLGAFLRHCDLAKFARWVLTVPEMQDLLASAVDFVTATTPTAAAALNKDRSTNAAATASHPLTPEAIRP